MKLVSVLIIYSAGFATAIYVLAPPSEGQSKPAGQQVGAIGSFDTGEFVASLSSGMHKAVALGKDAALRIGKFIKAKVNEKTGDTKQ